MLIEDGKPKSEKTSGEEESGSGKSYMAVYEKQSTEKAVRGTQLILHYIASKGIKVDPELINTLTFIKLKIERNEKLSAEEEANFWNAYTEVSNIIQPVTVKSLKCIREEFGVMVKGKKVSFAERVQTFYRKLSLLVLIVALGFQMIWLWQNYMLRDFLENTTHLKENFEKENNLSLDGGSKNLEEKLRSLKLERMELTEKLNAQRNHFFYRMYTSSNHAEESTKENKVEANITAKPEESPKDKEFFQNYKELYDKDFLIYVQALTFTIQILTLYLLPILFGVLGSCTYILRVIAYEIEKSIYVRDHDIQYALRLILGAFSGLVIGWFISSDAEIKQGFTPSKLSPFAISFLAGYSIDLLFTMMDKIVSLYSGSDVKKEEFEKQAQKKS